MIYSVCSRYRRSVLDIVVPELGYIQAKATFVLANVHEDIPRSRSTRRALMIYEIQFIPDEMLAAN